MRFFALTTAAADLPEVPDIQESLTEIQKFIKTASPVVLNALWHIALALVIFFVGRWLIEKFLSRVALLTGLIKPEQISTVADFFISIMPVLFIAPTVALITQPEHLAVMGGPVVLLGILGTTLVIGISGKAAQAVGRQEAKRREGKKHE